MMIFLARQVYSPELAKQWSQLMDQLSIAMMEVG